jgi:hypothetical protein
LTRLGLRSVHLVAHLLGSSVKWLQKYIVLFVHLLSHSSSSTTHTRQNQSSCLLKLGSKFPKREKKHPTTIATSPHHHHHHTCYNIKNNKKYSSSAWAPRAFFLLECRLISNGFLAPTYTTKNFFSLKICLFSSLIPLKKPLHEWMNDFYMFMLLNLSPFHNTFFFFFWYF